MITINLVPILFWLFGAGAIRGILPDDYKYELGAFIGIGIQVVWIIVCLVLFLGCKMHINVGFAN